MNKTNWNKMCRICGEVLEKPYKKINDYHEQINKYLPIEMDDNDYPRNVCIDCSCSISQWDIFYKQCQEAQRKFNLLLTPTLIEAEEKEKHLDLQTETEKKLHATTSDREKAERRMSCKFCSSHHESLQSLNDHLIADHCDLIFCCDICKNYEPRCDLIQHMTDHALNSPPTSAGPNSIPKSKKFQCPKCVKEFVSGNGLKYHMDSHHSKLRQFTCNDCNYSFACKRVLLNHIKSVHSKTKEYKCTDCDKRFKTDSSLYTHRKIHSDETPHKCDYCGKGFKFKHHLDVHSVQHTDRMKSFECNVCHKKFTGLNNLTKHRKIHDKSLEFVCHICGTKMSQRRYLKDHMKRVHQARLEDLEVTK